MKPFYALIFLALVCGFSTELKAQGKKKNVIEQGDDIRKLFMARQSFLAGDFVKALNLYKEVLVNKPGDAEVNYRIGEVYYAMELYDDAIEFLDKAKGINPACNPELEFTLARVHHLLGNIDKALESYNLFKTQLNNETKAKEYNLDHFIKQCNIAKDLMGKPVDVTITNAGDNVNSSYEDKGPSVTADGKTLVFNSRRPQGKDGQKTDKEGDFKFFEDIYMSKWDETQKKWTEAELLKGSVNTEGHDAVLSISPDGKVIFIYKNNETDAVGGDIFISKVQQSGKWGSPKPIGKPVNTTYAEFGACISSDGNTLLFVSESPKFGDQKGLGHGDIWMSKKISKTEWGIPTNLGAVVNTEFDEGGIFLHPDGKTLFFSSEGHDGMGSYDIFMTRLENGTWSKPVNLGYPINTTRKDVSFILSTDNNMAFFASDRPGGMGERDIWSVDMSRYDITGARKDKEWVPGLSILKGTVIVTESGKGTDAVVVIKDKETGNVVGQTNSSEDGEYFITLTGEKKYIIEVDKQGFDKVSEEFFLPADKKGTFTMVKHLLLNKPKKKPN